MRLINSTTHHMNEFYDNIPKYAILSHTWGDEEVSFQELGSDRGKEKAGYAKIESCCKQAERDGFEFVWIDTCCIDKTSSAELSEAVNSMYRWYNEAQICYAYLDDVTSKEDPQGVNSGFTKSKWFTRGWTLQELIAPSSVEFFAKEWRGIGTKLSLQKQISMITGIPIPVLKSWDVESFSVAQRMSWAAKRQTTRVEDRAYSLMGLFGINMPMLYGEGENAFARLQEEIMKTSDDHTIFAWTQQPQDKGRWAIRGLLANSATEFTNAGDIIGPLFITESIPYSMTNKGLHIELTVLPISDQEYFAFLDCRRTSTDFLHYGIFWRKGIGETFFRIFPDILEACKFREVGPSCHSAIYAMRKNVEDRTPQEPDLPFHIFLHMTPAGPKFGYYLTKVYAGFNEFTHLEDGSFLFHGQRTCVLGVLHFERKNTKAFVVALGCCEGLPWCDILTDIGNTTLERIYHSYVVQSHMDRVDRVFKVFQPGISVSVSIRKHQGKQADLEVNCDSEYSLQISVSLSERSEPSSSSIWQPQHQKMKIAQQGTMPKAIVAERSNKLRIRPNSAVIIIMGIIGAGKSTFIQHFTKERLEIGSRLGSATKSLEVHEGYLPDGQSVTLVDMPGFDSPYMSDTEVLLGISDWLQAAYLQRIMVNGILYFHRISDARIGTRAAQNLRMFQNLFGPDVLDRIIFVTTFWDTISWGVGDEREKQLMSSDIFIGSMLTKRHYGTADEAYRLVKELIGTKERSYLEIQVDIAERGSLLSEPDTRRVLYETLIFERDEKK